MKKTLFILFAAGLMISCSANRSYVVSMLTTAGEIELALYNEAPKHRDNFVKLAKEHVYDSLLFHRVIRDFMIQGGDPTSKNAIFQKINSILLFTVKVVLLTRSSYSFCHQ